MICPICQKEMKQVIHLIIQAKASRVNFNKTALREADVKILGADMFKRLLYCSEHGLFDSILAKLEAEESNLKK